MLRLLFPLCIWLWALPALAASNRLVEVHVHALEAEAGALIEVVGSRPPSFSLEPGDERLILSIDRAAWAAPVRREGAGPVLRLVGETAQGQARLILEVEKGAEARLATDGNTLRIRVQPGIEVQPAPTPPSATSDRAPATDGHEA